MENSNGPDPQARPKAATLQLTPFQETTAPKPALTHFFPFPSLKKPTWAGKSSSQEMDPQGTRAETIAVSGLRLFKSYHLLAENW